MSHFPRAAYSSQFLSGDWRRARPLARHPGARARPSTVLRPSIEPHEPGAALRKPGAAPCKPNSELHEPSPEPHEENAAPRKPSPEPHEISCVVLRHRTFYFVW